MWQLLRRTERRSWLCLHHFGGTNLTGVQGGSGVFLTNNQLRGSESDTSSIHYEVVLWDGVFQHVVSCFVSFSKRTVCENTQYRLFFVLYELSVLQWSVCSFFVFCWAIVQYTILQTILSFHFTKINFSLKNIFWTGTINAYVLYLQLVYAHVKVK